MRVTADRDVCIGAGMCVLTAPAVFDQSDDDGLVEVLVEAPAEAETAARPRGGEAVPFWRTARRGEAGRSCHRLARRGRGWPTRGG